MVPTLRLAQHACAHNSVTQCEHTAKTHARPPRQKCLCLRITLRAMTMTMTHSEKSHIRRMKAWPYRQECRGHDPTKKCFTDVTCSLVARCAGTNCLWTECIATRLEMDSRRKQKHGPQAIAVLNSQINHRILGFGATPQTKQEESRKPGSREGKTGRPGEAKAPRGRTAGNYSTAVVPAIGPNFCSLVRTKFVRKFFHLVENPSLSS